jgi:putative restriction endonuclease
MKIKTPDFLSWEVEAAHIVPHSYMGRDDIWNGLALCHLHHWAFDVGWFTLQDQYMIQVSSKVQGLPSDFGRFGDYEFIRSLSFKKTKIFLPKGSEFHPHHNAIRWHRENIFHQ